MISMQPLGWFALPVLLLPVWWHMRKRERTRTDLLATARFLPAATPQQQRMLRWSDVLLLLARLALLAVLIAWMAVLVMPWKGDTVFVAPELQASPWAEQQVQTAGMGSAAREPLPDDLWNWLALNEHEWRPEARFLILASSAAMPALPPRLAHAADLRLAPPAADPATPPATPSAATPPSAPPSSAAPSPAAAARSAAPSPAAAARSAAPSAVTAVASTAVLPITATALAQRPPRERHVVVSAPPERMARWQALFAAFGTAADGANRYVLSNAPVPATELIVWDHPDTPPPPSWKAPLWWRTAAANGQTQTPQGLTWTAQQWPLSDIDGARALYERWQQATTRPASYAMSAQTIKAGRSKPLPAPLARSPEWLALALLALFAIERILTHARRR